MLKSGVGHKDSFDSDSPRTVLLVEPQTLVRCGFRLLINSLPGYQVVAEAGTLQEAFSSIEQFEIDILLTEIALPGPSGIDILLELKRRQSSRPRVMIVSLLDSPEVVQRALQSGACSYISKDGDEDQLRLGLNAACSNQRYLSPSLKHLAAALIEGSTEGRAVENVDRAVDPLQELSCREREIFHLLADGLQNNIIAKKLYISPRTVETHRARIVRKLGVSSNGELIRFAIKHGLSAL